MADIRNYLRVKENRESSSDQDEDYRRKIRKHRLSFFYRISMAIIALCVMGVVAFLVYREHVYESYDVVATTAKDEVLGTTDMRLDKSILTYSKDGAQCRDAKGKAMWNQTFEMQSPMVSVCQDVVAIADYNGRRIYIYNTTEKVGEVETTMPIRSIAVSARGVVAAVLDDGDVTWIRAFGPEGNVLVEFKTSMKNFGYPVSVSLSPNSILCAVSYLYVDMGVVKSSLGFYNFGEVGQNQADNFVGGFDFSDSILPYVQFMTNNSVFAAGDDRLVFYRGNQKPENVANNLLSEEIQAVYSNEEYVGLVFWEGNGSKRLDIYDNSGNKKCSHSFQMEYTDILFDQDNFIIYNETELYIGTLSGREKYNGSFEKPVSLLVPTGTPYRYTVVTRDSIDTIRLQ